MNKTLVLIRHGHRDNSSRELDNGLDEKGKEQAKNIRRFFEARFAPDELDQGLWLVSSPKIRCVETLQPLAKALDRTVDIHPGLDEQSLREPGAGLDKRVQAFLSEWDKSKVALTVVSSHGDWLPVAVHHLLKISVDPKKGSWLEIEGGRSFAALKWYIPSFRHFFS